MASKYLGAEFDIHGGGIDLVFPHHENEIAQSCSVGDGYARYWLHNAWVTTSGEKMSKSLGNSLLVTEVVKRVRPIELRYYLGSAHYRSMLEFSYDALEESAVGFRRIEAFLVRAAAAAGRHLAMGVRSEVFDASMNDDLGVPGAVASMHDTVRAGNAARAVGDNTVAVTAAESVIAMLDVWLANDVAAAAGITEAAGGEQTAGSTNQRCALITWNGTTIGRWLGPMRQGWAGHATLLGACDLLLHGNQQ
jgi:cysteinyl-tRNA synthetase